LPLNGNFKVKRSNDGITFVDLGQLSAQANQGNQSGYSFLDQSPQKGIFCYRIIIQDLNDQLTWSNVHSVSQTREQVLFLKKTSNGFEIFTLGDDPLALLTIVDMTGRIVLQENWEYNKDPCIVSFELHSGTYILLAATNKMKQTFRLVQE